MNFRRNRESESPEINLIPLIDVLLVILIFLAASTSFTRFQQMKVSLPQAGADAIEPNAITLTVSQDGFYALNDQPLEANTAQEIAQALQQVVASATETVIVIHADARATHDSVVRVMQAARLAGIERINFATQGSP